MKLLAVLAGLLIGLGFAAPAGAEEIRLDQADGGTLLLPEPARRLVALSPHLTELVYEAGAGDLLFATVEFSEYPPPAASLPRIGDAFRLDIEGIVAWRPDLVIAWDSGNPDAAISQLRSMGLAVWTLEIREPQQIAGALRAIGRATGDSAQAEAAARQVTARLTGMQDRFRGAPARDYFYQVDARPLFTINGDHLISKGLQLCGGRNIFAGEPGLAFQVTRESVIVADPDAIFAPRVEGGSDPLSAWKAWPGMQAVASNALYYLPADKISRATVRWLDALEIACTLLHGSR